MGYNSVLVNTFHLHYDFINIIRNKGCLLPRSLTYIVVHILDSAVTIEVTLCYNAENDKV